MCESLILFFNTCRFRLFKVNIIVHGAGRRLDQRSKRLLAVVFLSSLRSVRPGETRTTAPTVGEASAKTSKSLSTKRWITKIFVAIHRSFSHVVFMIKFWAAVFAKIISLLVLNIKGSLFWKLCTTAAPQTTPFVLEEAMYNSRM